MNYQNEIDGRIETAVCALVLSATAPKNSKLKVDSLHKDARDCVDGITDLIEQLIIHKADALIKGPPEEFKKYFTKWSKRESSMDRPKFKQ